MAMRPSETLSLVEEAAGTRMFEEKKLTAQKTIEKKEQRVREITACMDGEITPQLEGLRKEREDYLRLVPQSIMGIHYEAEALIFF
jgi:structural maintenance of chromosome 2